MQADKGIQYIQVEVTVYIGRQRYMQQRDLVYGGRHRYTVCKRKNLSYIKAKKKKKVYIREKGYLMYGQTKVHITERGSRICRQTVAYST